MKPIPVAFHIGPIEIHTYGVGLAITFWFAYIYFSRRLRARGWQTDWVGAMFIWVIVSAVVGARAVHVLSNLSYYEANPSQIFAIWRGGLSSFGGILFALPAGLWQVHRRCPEIGFVEVLDIVAPVLMAAWAMGRVLGPQLMVAGGGHPTHQWFGMYYAGQVGKRLPVPIFQAIEDFAIFSVLLAVDRRLRRRAALSAGSAPRGVILGIAMVLWGLERFLDERLWLGEDGHLGSLLVQVAGVALAVGGMALLIVTLLRRRATGTPDVPDSAHAHLEPDQGSREALGRERV